MARCQACQDRRIRCSMVSLPHQVRCVRCEDLDLQCVALAKRPYVRRKFDHLRPGPPNDVSMGNEPVGRLEIDDQAYTSANRGTVLRQVQKICIALDEGTAYTKAGYAVFFANENLDPKLCQNNLIVKLRTVVWPNGEAHLPAQLAYEKHTDGSENYRQLWGDEVSKALKLGRITKQDVLQWIKPVLYGDERLCQTDKERLESQIDRLPASVQYPQGNVLNPGQGHKLSILDLYADSLRHLYGYVLKAIKDEHPWLPWPRWDANTQYRNFDPTQYTDIEVILAVPASSTPEHTQMALAAAKSAGLPRTYPIAEPVAACAFDFQMSFESYGVNMDPGCTLVVDVGGGSADLQAWEITQVAPFKLQEEVYGDAKWCGGRFVNDCCRQFVSRGCLAVMQEILNQLSNNGNRMTESEFLDVVEEKFEIAKRTFNGFKIDSSDLTILQIPGLPEIAFSHMKGQSIVLSQNDMIEIFEPSVTSIRKKINSIIRDFDRKYEHCEGPKKRIRKILLVGGGSGSPYLREFFIRTYETGRNLAAGYPIPVQIPNDSKAGHSTSTVLGALLLLIDKSFISERVLRRSYGMKWDVQVKSGKRYPSNRVKKDPHDGVMCETDVVKFLFKIGDRVSQHHEVIERRGWRGLFLNKKHKDGWELHETIFYSDTTSQDGLYAYDEAADIHEAGTLKFKLSQEDCREFEIRKSADGKRRYKYLEYAVGLTLDGIVMSYHITINRSGKFSDDDNPYGSNPIRQEGKFECAGVFQLFNCA